MIWFHIWNGLEHLGTLCNIPEDEQNIMPGSEVSNQLSNLDDQRYFRLPCSKTSLPIMKAIAMDVVVGYNYLMSEGMPVWGAVAIIPYPEVVVCSQQ